MQNIEAEEYLIGCILNEPEIIKEIKLNSHHFTERRQMIFNTMLKLDKENIHIDLPNIMSVIPTKENMATYITKLQISIPSVEPFKQYEKFVLEAWKKRESYKTLLQAQNNINESDIISKTIKNLSEIESTGYEEKETIKDKLSKLSIEMKINKGELTGIDTGYIDINELTEGWQNGELIILGASPGMGKSALAGNFTYNALLNGATVDFFNFEMTEELLLKRFISSIGQIEINKFKNPMKFFKDEDWDKSDEVIDKLGDYPLFIHNDIMTIQEMRGTIRTNMKKSNGKHLVVVDYLQKIKVDAKDSRNLEVTEISNGLKSIAKDFNVPVIAIASLKRGIDQRQDKKPVMSDLRDSGNIEFDADLIMFLYREEYYNPTTENKGKAELIVSKNRNGKVGTIPLYADLKYSLFRNGVR